MGDIGQGPFRLRVDMTTLLYLIACLMSPSPLINLAESRANKGFEIAARVDDGDVHLGTDLLGLFDACVECSQGLCRAEILRMQSLHVVKTDQIVRGMVVPPLTRHACGRAGSL